MTLTAVTESKTHAPKDRIRRRLIVGTVIVFALILINGLSGSPISTRVSQRE
jgi:hypothetical protein